MSENPNNEAMSGNLDVDPSTGMLTDDALAKFVNLAVNPHMGDAFEFGGRRFTRQFLTAESEYALLAVVTRVMDEMPTASIAESFLASLAALFEATALILADQDPEVDEEWVRAVRGAGLAGQMVTIVVGQMQIQQMTPLLGKLLAIAGLAQAVTSQIAKSPST